MHDLDVELVPADQVLLEEWSGLSTSVGAPFYSRPDRFIPWAKAFNQDYLHCLTARRQGQLVGLMPVIPQGGMVSAAVNSETRVFCPVLTDSVNPLQVITAIPSRWRRVSLAYVPETMFSGRDNLHHSAKRRVEGIRPGGVRLEGTGRYGHPVPTGRTRLLPGFRVAGG